MFNCSRCSCGIRYWCFNDRGGDDNPNTNTEQSVKQEEKSVKHEEQTKVEVTVTAVELSKEFEANELNAKDKYSGKYAEITGTVQSVDEMVGSKFVVLNGDESDPSNITAVQCFLTDEGAEKAKSLSKGQEITVVGKIDGRSINVGVNDCNIK